MRENRPLLHIALAVIMILAAVGGFAGGRATYAALNADETASVFIKAADDVTVDVGAANLTPDSIEYRSKGTFKAKLDVPDGDRVVQSRFSLRIRGRDGVATAISAKNCEDVCTVTFSREELSDIAGSPGTYTVLVRGWWQRDRMFRATATVTITRGSDDGSSASTTSSSDTASTTTTTTTESSTNVTAE